MTAREGSMAFPRENGSLPAGANARRALPFHASFEVTARTPPPVGAPVAVHLDVPCPSKSSQKNADAGHTPASGEPASPPLPLPPSSAFAPRDDSRSPSTSVHPHV